MADQNGAGICQEGANLTIRNCYVHNNEEGILTAPNPASDVGSSVTAPVLAQNNISYGSPTFVSQEHVTLVTNCLTNSPLFVNPAQYDYHLQRGSPCINAGSAPRYGAGYSLMPVYQYVHPTSHKPRTTVGIIDAGAFEYGD